MMLQPKGVEIASPLGMRAMLEEDRAGPIHYLLAAGLFGMASPLHKFVLANRGLQELSAEAFRRDVTVLLNQKGVTSQTTNVLADLLRSLDEPDLDDLAELLRLDDDDRALVTRLLKELNRRRDEPANVLLPELAEQAWPALSPRVEAALRQLAVPPASPPRGAKRVTQQPTKESFRPLPD